MRLDDFTYLLPEELIAQNPLAERAASKLMLLQTATCQISHHRFRNLPSLLREGDLLVRNETRVIPARLLGRKESGGQIEVLLVRPLDEHSTEWLCMTKSSKPVRHGTRLFFPGNVVGEVVSEEREGQRRLLFAGCDDFQAYLEQHGHMPLPPYIDREDRLEDRERYQTVFARHPGAVAAPTAGLHFTAETFANLAEAGVEVCGITLHVGPGTFLPVRTDDLRDHRMHKEVYEITKESALRINMARRQGRRVVALGTTVTRTLESAADDTGEVQAGRSETELFILPGYAFKTIDALITNFHLPKSTLLMLVAAFAGREFILDAYREAIERRYRFFSYGDCMLIE